MAQIGYTVPQAAAQVGLSERTIRDAIKDNYLPVRYLGIKALVKHQDLEDWFDKLPSESPR